LQSLVKTYSKQARRHAGTGYNSDQKETDVCRTVTKNKTFTEQKTKILFYNNILELYILNKTCKFDGYDYSTTVLMPYVLTTLM
jgi:hypothetical protein